MRTCWRGAATACWGATWWGERVVNALAATGQEEFVHGASVMSGYGWHRLSRYHAGETVAAAPSAAPQRWADQVYLRRNHISRPTLGPWAIADANGWRWVLAKAAAWDAGFDYYGAATDAARHDAALRREIRGWRNAQLAGAFDWPARFGMRQPADTFRLDKVQQRRALGPSWRLAEWTPVGAGGGTRGRSRSLAPQLRGAPLTNLAPDARVTVSGVLDRSYAGALAVDSATGVGAVAGAPGLTGSGEWALAGDAGEKWIELAWDTPQKVRGVWLFDRAQTGHNVTAGTLTLTRADNSTTDHTVSGLDPAGAPKVVDLPPQTLRKVRFTITASTGTAPGLAELVVLGPGRAYQAGTLASGAGVRGVPSAEAARLTDGVIGARADQYATLTGNHAVLDLGGQYYVNGLAVWHYFGDPRTYHDVVVEVASRADFTDASIVFNNDTDNSLGLGAGTDEEYRERPAGKQVQFAPLPGRYLRLWSSGNTVNAANHLTEVEVYGAGNGSTDAVAVTGSHPAARALGNLIDHDPATLADAGAGAQYLQLDLGATKTVNSLLVMRDNTDMRTYRGVVYRLSTSADFSRGVSTVFHNDHDGLQGLGLGPATDGEHQETENGRTVRFAPLRARYVRVYSAGSNVDASNRYRELLVGTDEAGLNAPPGATPAPPAALPSLSAEWAPRTASARILPAPPAPGISARQQQHPGQLRRLVTPTAIALTAGDEFSSLNLEVAYLIDGSGLSATPTLANLASVTSTTEGATAWVTATTGDPTYFSSGNNPEPQFILTLDNAYRLSALVVWGVTGALLGSEATDFTLEFSTVPFSADASVTYAREQVATTQVLGETSATLDFPQSRTHWAKYVRITITNNAGNRGLVGVEGHRVGLSELRFIAVAPPAVAATLTTPGGTAVSLDLASLVASPDGAALTYTVGDPSRGTVSLTGSLLTYTPAAGFYGPDRFTYTVTDNAGLSSTAAVSVTVSRPGAARGFIRAGDLVLALDPAGNVVGLTDSQAQDSTKSYHVAGQSRALLSLVVEAAATARASAGNAAHYRPTGWTYRATTGAAGARARGEYTFTFADNLSVAVLLVEKPGYATLEVTSIVNPDGKDIRLVLWGPLPTTLTETVADKLGVVSNRDVAVGLLGVNAKTLGGWPMQYPAPGYAAQAVGGAPAGALQRAVRDGHGASRAVITTFGTALQAYTQDYTTARLTNPLVVPGDDSVRPLAALAEVAADLAAAGQLVGSKVALLGLTRRGTGAGNLSLREVMSREILARISAIEVGEGLPHPIIGKVWGKYSEKANAPHLVLTDLASANLNPVLQWANELGWEGVSRDSAWGVFQDGTATLHGDFGGTLAGLRAAVVAAANRRVRLGSHFLLGGVTEALARTFPGGLLALHSAAPEGAHHGHLERPDGAALARPDGGGIKAGFRALCERHRAPRHGAHRL